MIDLLDDLLGTKDAVWLTVEYQSYGFNAELTGWLRRHDGGYQVTRIGTTICLAACRVDWIEVQPVNTILHMRRQI